jgi:hypothetical protein
MRARQILIYPFILASASFAGVLHPMVADDYTAEMGRATAHFDVPRGWRALPIARRTPHHATLVYVNPRNKHLKVAVSLDFYHIHSFETDKTQQGCADDYLDGVQRHADPDVEMDIVSTFQSGRNGAVNIYRCHSEYWREGWTVFIVKGDYEVQIEVYAHDFAGTAQFAGYLRAVADGVSIDGV